MHVYKWYNEQGEEYDIHLLFNLNYLQRHGISGFCTISSNVYDC